MSNPTEKPNFEAWAINIYAQAYNNTSTSRKTIEKEIEKALQQSYEQGYHVGLIYGWGLEQDEDSQTDLSLATYKDGKRKEQALEEARDELRELDIVGELDEILGKNYAKRYSGVEDELDPFDPL